MFEENLRYLRMAEAAAVTSGRLKHPRNTQKTQAFGLCKKTADGVGRMPGPLLLPPLSSSCHMQRHVSRGRGAGCETSVASGGLPKFWDGGA